MPKEGQSAIRSLERGLKILTEVSRNKGILPGELSKIVEIPRPSVYRILDALEELGYVSRSATDNRFRIAAKARQISQGYDDETRAGELGGPIITALQSKVIWPVDLFTFENGFMVCRESTLWRSPFSIDRNMIGRRIPILHTASGLAWLAFSSIDEQALCLDLLRHRGNADDLELIDTDWLQEKLEACRSVKYAVRQSGKIKPKTSSVAAPVIHNGRVVCTITVIWIASAMSMEKARETLILPLLDATAQLADRFSQVGAA